MEISATDTQTISLENCKLKNFLNRSIFAGVTTKSQVSFETQCISTVTFYYC